MALHMIRLDPDPQRIARWGVQEGLGKDDGYIWHAVLRAAFGERAPKPFRVLERPGRPVQLLGYTTSDQAALLSHAQAFADPAALAALCLDSLAVKGMPAVFAEGVSLRFEVRVRPVVRQDRDGDRSRSRERDAFLVAIEKVAATAKVDRSEVYLQWLKEQLQRGGAALVSAKPTALRRERIARRDAVRKLIETDGPDVVFDGTLKITNPQAFAGLLARGVGRHRSFGYGMLLLSPARGR